MKLSNETRNALRTGKSIFAAKNAIAVVCKPGTPASLVVAFLNARRERHGR